MDDLLNGDLPTYLWLYTTEGQGNFVWWSETTDKEPQVWQTLLTRLWSLRGTEAGRRALIKLKEAQRA